MKGLYHSPSLISRVSFSNRVKPYFLFDENIADYTFDNIDTAFDFINTPSLSLKKFANTIKY